MRSTLKATPRSRSLRARDLKLRGSSSINARTYRNISTKASNPKILSQRKHPYERIIASKRRMSVVPNASNTSARPLWTWLLGNTDSEVQKPPPLERAQKANSKAVAPLSKPVKVRLSKKKSSPPVQPSVEPLPQLQALPQPEPEQTMPPPSPPKVKTPTFLSSGKQLKLWNVLDSPYHKMPSKDQQLYHILCTPPHHIENLQHFSRMMEKLDNLGAVEKLYHEMKHKQLPMLISTYVALFLAAKNNNLFKIDIAYQMSISEPEVKPNVLIFREMIHTWASMGNVIELESYYNQYHKLFTPSLYVYNTLIDAQIKHGTFEAAVAWLDKLKEDKLQPNANSYAPILASVVKNGTMEDVLSWAQKMKADNVKLNATTTTRVLEAMKRTSEEQSKLEWALTPDAPLTLHFTNAKIVSALYEEIGDHQKAGEYLRANIQLAESTKASTHVAYSLDAANLTAILQSLSAKNVQMTARLEADGNGTLAAYLPNLQLYNAMLKCYMNDSKGALQLFDRMQEWILPDYTTLKLVTLAHCGAGATKPGAWLQRITSEFGVVFDSKTLNEILDRVQESFPAQELIPWAQRLRRWKIPINSDTLPRLIESMCNASAISEAIEWWKVLIKNAKDDVHKKDKEAKMALANHSFQNILLPAVAKATNTTLLQEIVTYARQKELEKLESIFVDKHLESWSKELHPEVRKILDKITIKFYATQESGFNKLKEEERQRRESTPVGGNRRTDYSPSRRQPSFRATPPPRPQPSRDRDRSRFNDRPMGPVSVPGFFGTGRWRW